MKKSDLTKYLSNEIEKRDRLLLDCLDLLNEHLKQNNKQLEIMQDDLEKRSNISNQIAILIYNVRLLTRASVHEKIKINMRNLGRLTVADFTKLLNIKESSFRNFLKRNLNCPQPIKEQGLKSYFKSDQVMHVIDYLVDNSHLIQDYDHILRKFDNRAE